MKIRDVIFSILKSIGISVPLKLLRVNNKELVVLMFHRISDELDPLWNPMPIKKFELLMELLKNNTYVFPIEKINEIRNYPTKPLVAISFDDGYRDFYFNAYPILKKYNLPAHHNICPGLIDGKSLPWTQYLNLYLSSKNIKFIELPDKSIFQINGEVNERNFLDLCKILSQINSDRLNEWMKPIVFEVSKKETDLLMSWDMIRNCSESGIHIGSHSLTHQNLAQLTDEIELNKEINGSRKRIQEEVEINPRIFAFPNGFYNKKSLDFVIKSGFSTILLCEDKISIFEKDHSKKKSHIFPRINISGVGSNEEYLRTLGFHQRINKILKYIKKKK